MKTKHPDLSSSNTTPGRLYCHTPGCSWAEQASPIDLSPGSTPQCPGCRTTALFPQPKGAGDDSGPVAPRRRLSLVAALGLGVVGLPLVWLIASTGATPPPPPPPPHHEEEKINEHKLEPMVVDTNLLRQVQEVESLARSLCVSYINLPNWQKLGQLPALQSEQRRLLELQRAYTNAITHLAIAEVASVDLAVVEHLKSLDQTGQTERQKLFRYCRRHLQDARKGAPAPDAWFIDYRNLANASQKDSP